MRLVKKLGVLFLFSILFTVTGFIFTENRALASSTGNLSLKINGKTLSGNESMLGSREADISVYSPDGLPVGTVVTWRSTNAEVVQLENTTGASVVMQRKGPGFATITASVLLDGRTYTLSRIIKVQLMVDNSPAPGGTGTTAANHNANMVLELNQDEERQIVLKYVEYNSSGDAVTGSAITATDLDYVSNNTKVVTVNSNGKVTAKGAGDATITISTRTVGSDDAVMKDTIRVVVIPTFTLTAQTAAGDTINYNSGKTEEAVYRTGIPSTFTLKTNGNPASNITWKIYDASDKSSTRKPLTSGGKVTFSISELDNMVRFSSLKAGTYEIYAFSNDEFGVDSALSEAYMKIEVPIDIESRTITMIVNDIYDIVKATNIPSANTFSSYVTSNPNIVRTDTSGKFTARSRGTATVTCKYNGSLKLFDIAPPDMVLTVHVIDAISLSQDNAILYKNGTLQLTANKTDDASEVIWSSSNTSIATVDKDGLVTAKSKGEVIITASQTINGVEKKAICQILVKSAVDTITLYPDKVPLAIGEAKTITANIKPEDGLDKVKLEWRTSDKEVVYIDTYTDRSVTVIAGKKGGHAVITAVNQDNVVVGFSHISVQQPVISIALSETSITTSLNSGRIQLRATCAPDDAINKKVNWDSSDTSKATVDDNGLVTIKKTGTVSIIASSDDNPSVKAICNINILVPVGSIALDETTKEMYSGQTARLGYTILPVNASNAAVTWTSTNTSVATVDGTGLVTAKGVGSTVIILRSVDKGLSVYCTINVKRVATGLKLDVSTLDLEAGKTYTFKPTISPADSTDATITWESTDTKIATVDANGKVTGKAAGQTVIIAKIASGGTAYCKVTVKQSATGLILNFSEKTVYVGEKFGMTASVKPSTASQLGVKWESSNTKVATITEKGEVTALAGGVTIITATTLDGGYVANCVLTVREAVSKISINYQTYYLGVDKFAYLEATVSSPNATNQKVAWSSSNEDVVTVNQKGKITGHKLGHATITAMALDGSEVEATCEVRVVIPASSVSVNYNTIALLVGQTKKVKVTVKPDNATFKTAKWTTSDDSVAIVDDDGVIIAKKAGSATVTAEAKDNSGKKALVYVSVYDRIASTGITLQDKKVVMLPGEEKKVQLAMIPANSNDEVTWSTDNAAVAKVDKKTGRITARSTGVAYVTVMTDSGKTATVEVVVIGLNITELTLEQYTTYQYPLEVEGATSAVSWSIDNPKVAVVNNGIISSRGTGTAIITAKVNGRKLTCRLKVVKIGTKN
jgi:uncharacterized protein YjdB